MVYSVRTKAYVIVALNTDAVTAASALVDHARANGLGIDEYVVICNSKRLGNVARWIEGLR